jgi:histidinol phosphatase-like enzyme
MKNKIFLDVDFDGTIANKINDQLVLIDGAKEVLQRLKEANCYILIDSNRANSYRKKEGTVERSLNEMKEFLDNNQIPYDAIAGLTFKIDGKPIADYYVSHNNITMTTWSDVIQKILGVQL